MTQRPPAPRAADRDRDADTLTKPVVKPETRPAARLARPPKFKVLLHNDDFTPREFVVQILKLYFYRGEAEARLIMLQAHRTGIAVAGVYPFEIAETKVELVMAAAEEADHPLLCTMEPAEDGTDDP